MDDLKGKKILITGLLSERSISYGIANACKEYGAELIFTYAEDSLKSRTEKLLSHFNSNFYLNTMLNLKMMDQYSKIQFSQMLVNLMELFIPLHLHQENPLKVTLLILIVSKVLTLHIKSAVIVLEIWPKTYHRC